MKKILFFLICVFISFLAFAGEIYVNPGDNLQNAVDNASGGDVIIINGGTYGPLSITNRRFSESAPLIIKKGIATPTIKNNSISSGRAIYLSNVSYIAFDGLKLEGGMWGFRAFDADHVVLINSEITGQGQEGIQARNGCQYLDIINVTIHHVGLYNPQWGEGIYLGGDQGGNEYLWVENCTIYECARGEAINIKSGQCKYVTITGNYIHDIHPGTSSQWNGGAIAVDQHNSAEDKKIWIQNNTIDGVYGGATSNTGIMTQQTGTRILYNTINNCNDRGIWFNNYNSDAPCWHYGNSFSGNGQDIYESQGAVVYYEDSGLSPYSAQTWYNGGVGSNTNPIANAGIDQTIEDSDMNGSETATLDGSGSFDSDGSIVSYKWEEEGNQIATGVSPSVNLAVGTHTLTLIVTDDEGATGNDDVVITVNAAGSTYNVALNKPVSATAEQVENEAEDAVDGSKLEEDRWSAEGFPQSLEIDLQQNYDIDKVDVYPLSDRAYQYTVEAKSDEGTYNTIIDRSTNTTGGNVISDSFSPVSARFVKITVTGASGYTGSWVSFREVEVFGVESGTPANQPPIANAGQDQTVEDIDDSGSETVSLDGSGSSDSDGSVVSYTWEEGGIQIATGVSPTVDLSVGLHTITLIVTDDDGAINSDDVVITVNEGSGASTVTNVALNKPVSASAWQDDTYGYQPPEEAVDGETNDESRWSANGFPQWLEIDLQQNFDIEQIDIYPFQDRAYRYIVEAKGEGDSYITIIDRSSNTTGGNVISDSFSPVSARFVKITVTGASGYTGSWVSFREVEVFGVESGTPANQPPIANAGQDQTVEDIDDSGSETVSLDGSGSSDSDGSVVSYTWEEGGNQIATGVSPTVDLSVGTHTITLIVTDDDGATGSDDVIITVNAVSSGPITLNPTQDSYVRDNGTQDGTGSTLITKDGYTGWKREAFLMFDLSTIGLSSANNATLRLYSTRYDGGNSELYQIADDNWTETGITWDNKPASGALISSQSGSVGYMEWDVTSFITNELASDNLASFRLVASDDAFINFNSKEASSNWPELVINDPLKHGRIKNMINHRGDETDDLDISVYPNPFIEGNVKIVLNRGENIQIEVINSVGQVIYFKTMEGDRQHLINRDIFKKPGIYILSIKTEGNIKNFRLIIGN